jgi:hypothetical protein
MQCEPRALAALAQLDRILASQSFKRVHPGTRAFILFVLAKKILGQEEEIKEITLASAVYQDDNYDPAEHHKIRELARSLRLRLDKYYETEGQRDPILIRIPCGGYVPEIVERHISIGLVESPPRSARRLCRHKTI